jgi:hypothetical protein
VGNNGEILRITVLQKKYNIICKQLDYERLMHAIPTPSKKVLKEYKMLNANYCVFKECKVSIQENNYNVKEVNTKQLYWHQIRKISKRPTSEDKWNQKLEFVIDEPMWDIIYTNYQKILSDTSIKNFHFKITHRILACNYNLHIWKIRPNNRCDSCNQIDTIEHMLIYCEETYTFWQRIFNWWFHNMV